jgi:thiamine biosynthesis lipoprotein
MTPTLARLSFPVWGTTAELITTAGSSADAARSVLDSELAAIDAACSRFRADSELTALNRADGAWLTVSDTFLDAVEVALVAARHTDGAVDPTVGVALRLLGYDRDFAAMDTSVRSGAAVTALMGAVPGWRCVQIDRASRRARLPAGVEMDLGATAKAWAADRAARRAAATTGAGVLVALGGDVAVAGDPPPGGWLVRVTDDHRGPADAPGQTVAVTGGSLATSSTTVRAWKLDGRRVHHIVDPTSGSPSHGPWRTVSVAAASCVDANTAATAALVLGGGAEQWLSEHGLPARLVADDGRVATVAGWPAEAT